MTDQPCSGNDNTSMMKLLHRGIIFFCLLGLVLLTYFAGIPGMGQSWNDSSNEVDPTPSISKEMVAQHAAIEKEWEEFYAKSADEETVALMMSNKVKSVKKAKIKEQEKEEDLKNSFVSNELVEEEWEAFYSKTKKRVKPLQRHGNPIVKDGRNRNENKEINNNKKAINDIKMSKQVPQQLLSQTPGVEGKTKKPFWSAHSPSVQVPKHISTDNEKEKIPTVEKTTRKVIKRKHQKIILIYTYLHKQRAWYNLPLNLTKDYLKRTNCKYHNCIVTYDKDYFHLADIVLFHDRNTPSTSVLENLSIQQYRPPSQRWVFFTSESPLNSEYGTIPFNGYFNWTMTYKLNSDIFLPYYHFKKLRPSELRPDSTINYAANKSRGAVWLVGNCKFAFRMDFAHLLAQHYDVSVGGGCRDQFKKTPNCTRWCPVSEIKAYKFYLSFENGVCADYITEKYSRYLELGLVPIVLGGANYSDPRLAIPGSFIDASKFKSIKALGEYLSYLDKNDTAYNEYFSWKQYYKIWHPPVGDWPFESYFLCKMCEKLNQDLPKKVYTKLSDFWNEHTDCELPEKKLRDRFIPAGFNFESRERDKEEKRRSNAAKIAKDFDEDFT